MEKWCGEERGHGKKMWWIPLVGSTYQVISVLLHCLTAEKPHKTRGGWGVWGGGAETTQRDYCSSDQTGMDWNKKDRCSNITLRLISKTMIFRLISFCYFYWLWCKHKGMDVCREYLVEACQSQHVTDFASFINIGYVLIRKVKHVVPKEEHWASVGLENCGGKMSVCHLQRCAQAQRQRNQMGLFLYHQGVSQQHACPCEQQLMGYEGCLRILQHCSAPVGAAEQQQQQQQLVWVSTGKSALQSLCGGR